MGVNLTALLGGPCSGVGSALREAERRSKSSGCWHGRCRAAGMRGSRRAKRMLLTSAGLTAGTLLFSCGPGNDEVRSVGSGPGSGGASGGALGTGGIHGNPKGCLYDEGIYDDCRTELPPSCRAGAGPGGQGGEGGQGGDDGAGGGTCPVR